MRRTPALFRAAPLLYAIVVGLLGGIAVVLAFQVDQSVAMWLQERAESIRSWFIWPLLVTGIGIIGGWILSYPNGKRLLIGYLVPTLGSTLVVHFLKWSVGRARPFVGLGSSNFSPWLGGGDHASFPSGHTQAAFAIATIWVLFWPQLRWVGLLWAPVVAFERMLSDKHYLSDVIAGAAVGTLSTLIAVQLLGLSYYRMDAERIGAANQK